MKKQSYIAIVDDEQDIVELISYNLKRENYKTMEFFEGEKFLRFVEKKHFDLVILDLMLPGVDGLEICRRMKSNERLSDIPIIMITAKDSEADKVVGLELGADDYIIKPFSVRELIARVKAVLRRVERKTIEKNVLKFEDLLINKEKYIVKIKNKTIDLTPTEFRILYILFSKPGRVFQRETLLEKLWGMDKIVLDRTIDVHIVKLRNKLGEYGKYIKSIRGIGYKAEEII